MVDEGADIWPQPKKKRGSAAFGFLIPTRCPGFSTYYFRTNCNGIVDGEIEKPVSVIRESDKVENRRQDSGMSRREEPSLSEIAKRLDKLERSVAHLSEMVSQIHNVAGFLDALEARILKLERERGRR